MLKVALAVWRKDLGIELRSRVLANQVVPVTLVVVMLFGFGLDANTSLLRAAFPGLYWVSVFFGLTLAVARAAGIEAEAGAAELLRLAGIPPAGVFLGKVAAVATLGLGIELITAAAAAVLFNAPLVDPGLLVASALLADLGVASVGVVLAQLATGERAAESLLPLLTLPVVSPVLLAASKAWTDALEAHPLLATPWVEVLLAFSCIYLILGMLVYGVVLEG